MAAEPYDLVVRAAPRGRRRRRARRSPWSSATAGSPTLTAYRRGRAGRRRGRRCADDEVLLPGLVDTHVHVNEPGRTEWEGFASATRGRGRRRRHDDRRHAAQQHPADHDGGRAARSSAAVARARRHVDVGFWGGAVPGNLDDLAAAARAQGVFGFKCFLLPSGVEEFPHLDADGLDDAMARAGPARRAAARARRGRRPRSPRRRPRRHVVRRLPGLAPAACRGRSRSRGWSPPPRQTRRPRPHRPPVRRRRAAADPRRPARDGVRLTVETCPHYLTFAAEEVARRRHGVQVLPADPRGRQPRRCSGRRSPTAPSTSSSPTTRRARPTSSAPTPATSAPPGVASPPSSSGCRAVWTEARRARARPRRRRRAGWPRARPTSSGSRRKGRIAVGADADLCAFAPDERARWSTPRRSTTRTP